MASLNTYLTKVSEYETAYINYLNNPTNTGQLNSINGELKDLIDSFIAEVRQQETNIETLKTTTETKLNEYKKKKKELEEKQSYNLSILQDEVKNDKKLSNINNKLNRKNNIILFLVIINTILGLFFIALIVFVLILKSKLKFNKVFNTKVLVNNNKSVSNNNKSLSNRNSNNKTNTNTNKSNSNNISNISN